MDDEASDQQKNNHDGNIQNIDKVDLRKTYTQKQNVRGYISNENVVSYRRKPTLVSEKICCRYCGMEHPKGRDYCPAFGKQCNNCGLMNHFKIVCQQSRRAKGQQLNQIDEFLPSKETEENEVHVLYRIKQIDAVKNSGELFFARLKVNNRLDLKCQIDTGASCNVLSLEDYCAIMQSDEPSMLQTKAKLRLYDGTVIAALGECVLKCTLGKASYKINFKIVPGKQYPLLSGNTCLALKLVTINTVNRIEMSNDNLISDFKDVFEGLGCLDGEYSIVIDPTVKPIQHVPRRVPLAIKDKIKEKLDELEAQGIVKKVNTPTAWISSMVVVQKPGKLRLCIDPRDLNQAIQRPKYQIPTLEDILPLLSKARFFSVLDAKDGFHQVRLDDCSSFLTTFWTPFGRYRYLRMPFGISSAPEEWQRRMHEVFGDIPGVAGITDDLLVFGSGLTDEEALLDHDKNLRNVLMRAREKNVKMNLGKLRLRLQEVRYMGHLLTKDGIRPDPLKIQAIKDMPKPSSKKDVQRLLGCVNYLARFLPELSVICEPLRKLTEQSALFAWESQQDEAYSRICDTLSQAPVLKYYNVQEEATLQCDASEKGLGAVLMQNGQPVAFASKALNRTEQCYAQIEKECLAILFACNRFDQYIQGKDVITIVTDHKPLISIFKKPLLNAPKRLQRMLLGLQKYNLDVTFKPGKEIVLADMLSRATPKMYETQTLIPSCEIFQIKQEQELFSEVESINPVEYLRISEPGLQETRKATKNDSVLQLLKKMVLNGWPEMKEKVPLELREFWSYRDEITTYDDLLFKGQQIIIPKVMRSKMMDRVHSSHQGADASIRLAKDIIFWPGMTSAIKETVSTCGTCNSFLSKQPKQPLVPLPVPQRPWELVGQDLFSFQGKDYLITVDYYSGFWEIDNLENTLSKTVVECTKAHFARHGIPNVVITDNGPQFISEAYETLARKWGFKHDTSSPYHHQCNGKAESAVKIAKSLLKKATHDNQDFELALLCWRNTPQIDKSSPVQKLMSRRTKTIIPTEVSLLNPEVIKKVPEFIEKRKQDAKLYYDKNAKELPELQQGDVVRIQPVGKQKTWQQAKVVQTAGPRSFVVRTKAGTEFRRNRRFLKRTCEKFQLMSGSEKNLSGNSQNNKEPQTLTNTRSHIPVLKRQFFSIPVPTESRPRAIEPPLGLANKEVQQMVSTHRETNNAIHNAFRSSRVKKAPLKFKDFVCN